MSLTTKILNAAMASSEQVFVNWAPHVKWLTVTARPADTDYSIENRHLVRDIFCETVDIDDDEHLAKVLGMIEELG